MRIISLLIFILICAVPSSLMAFGGCESDCLKCHSLKPSEAREVLAPIIPDAAVKSVSVAPAKGLWEVQYTSKGKKGLAYLDFSLNNIIIGQIIEIKTKHNLTRERMMEIAKVDFSSIPLDNSIVLGNPDASRKIVVFSDPDCPYCQKLHKELHQVISTRSDIAFYIKLFPLPMHKDSRRKSEAILCDKSLKILEDAYAKKKVPDPSCKNTRIDENITLAKKLGITGTPAIIFSDGRVIPGFLKSDEIIKFAVDSGS